MKKIINSILGTVILIMLNINAFNAQDNNNNYFPTSNCPNHNSFLKDSIRKMSLENLGLSVSQYGALYLDQSKNMNLIVSQNKERLNINELYGDFDLDNGSTFESESETKSRFDTNRINRRYQQYYNGIKIVGGGYTETFYKNQNSDSKVEKIAPFFASNIAIETTPNINSIELNSILNAFSDITSELVIKRNMLNECQYRLVWEVDYFKNGNKTSWIDAMNGAILKTINSLDFKNAPTEDYGGMMMEDTEDGNFTQLITGGSTIIQTYDFNRRDWIVTTPDGCFFGIETGDFAANLIPTSPITNNNWTIADGAQNVFQAHHIVTETADIYSQLGIDFENIFVGANVRNFCGPTEGPNAGSFASVGSGNTVNSTHIIFGESNLSTLAEYDIAGHELGHSYLHNWIDTDQAGNASLHEGIADMFGIYVEAIAQSNDWEMGDNVPLIIRDLENPVHDCFSAVQNLPREDRHERSTPLGHWFYLITVGESCLSGIGLQTAMDVVLEALPDLPSDADYPEFKNATMSVVNGISFGPNSHEAKVLKWAWDRICVPTPEQWFHINGEVVWDSDRVIDANYIIEDNGILVIRDCNLTMGSGKVIVIKGDGKLLINNSTLASCGDTWEGIRFCNDEGCDGGELTIENNSLIENAEIGIELSRGFKLTIIGKSTLKNNETGILGENFNGGIMNIDGAIFENNEVAIKVRHFDCHDFSIRHTEFIDNGTGVYFYDCNFVLDDSPIINDCDFISSNAEQKSHCGISGLKLTWLSIYNCKFTNNLFQGIHLILSDYVLTDNCEFTNQERWGMRIDRSSVGINIRNSKFTNILDAGIKAYDGSKFKIEDNNIFTNCENGIISTNSDFEVFDYNQFVNIQGTGISAIDSKLKVKNENSFTGCHYGIRAFATANNTAEISVKDNNSFVDNDWGIQAYGQTGNNKSKVSNNYFENNSHGAIGMGNDNMYTVNNNVFAYNDINVLSGYTGSEYNEIKCNDMIEQDAGILILGVNSETTFLGNDFMGTDNDGIDYGGWWNADIADDIGDDNMPAMNLFSGVLKDIVSGNDCSHFVYWMPETPILRDEPTNPGNYNAVRVTFNEVLINCSEIEPPGGVTDQEIIIVKYDYCYWYNLYRSNPNNSYYRWMFNKARKDYHLKYYYWAKNKEEEGSWEEIEEVLKTICKFQWKIRLYGHYFKRGLFNKADSMLYVIEDPSRSEPPIVPEDISIERRESFVAIQRVNLRYQMRDSTYQVSTAELLVLNEEAIKPIPEAAYANGLLYLLTGKALPMEIPDLFGSNPQPLAKEVNAKNWSVFPNPTDDKLFINYNDKTKFEGKLILYDLLGSKLLENKLVFKGNTLYDFDVSSLINGTYLLVIIDKDRQLMKSKKIIISK